MPTHRVAYLTNVYPAVSHSFIKREIHGLESRGFSVRRWSIRPFPRDLPDPSDRREAEQTEVLLARPARILLATLLALLRHPLRALRAIRASMVGRPAGLRAFIVRLAHFAEGCCLARETRAAGIDHVHAHFGTNPAAVAQLSYLLGGPPYSFTVHGPDEFDQPITYNLAGKVADARFAVAISAYGRGQLLRWSDLGDWERVRIVRCGLDSAFLRDPGAPAPAQGVPTFSCVARLSPQKGLPVLIEAATLLRSRGLQFRIQIAGDGDLRPYLEAAIAARGLNDCFELLGWASSEAVRKVIAGSRAFVLPSFAEGLPVAIMEAFALCRPVIVSRIAGIPELVDDSCGWVVDAGCPTALADAMQAALAASAEQLATMGQEGRKRVFAAHDADRNAGQLAELILSGLNQGAAR